MRNLALGCVLTMAAAVNASAQAEGDPLRGAQVYRACAACHTLEPGHHLTGPSLAGVWERAAGVLPEFRRYSDALRISGIVWTAETLDAWIADPQGVVPGNTMVFAGLPDAQDRADLIALLEAESRGEMTGIEVPSMPALPDLKRLDDANKVTAITHCEDSYRITTADGATALFWAFNLRFKTDGSDSGPRPEEPVLLPAGMQGDRAQVIFSAPSEISAFIREECP